MGPQSSFVCATNQLALFAAFESILISSLSKLTKATTAGMNTGNQATGALFYGLYSFGLLDLLLLCFSGDLMFCFLCGLHLSTTAEWMHLVGAVPVRGPCFGYWWWLCA